MDLSITVTFGFVWPCTRKNCPKSLIIWSRTPLVTMNVKLLLPTLTTVRFCPHCWSVRVLWNIPKLRQAIITIRIRRPMNWCKGIASVRVIRRRPHVDDQCSILSAASTLKMVRAVRSSRARPCRWPKTMSNRCIRTHAKHCCTARIMFLCFR